MQKDEFISKYVYSSKSFHRIRFSTCYIDPEDAMLCRLYIFPGENEELRIVMRNTWDQEVSYFGDWINSS